MPALYVGTRTFSATASLGTLNRGPHVADGQGVRLEGRPRMATIRASCPTCGDVELTTRDVTVQVCSTNNQGSYAFRCPDCRMAVSKPAEARIVDLLVS